MAAFIRWSAVSVMSCATAWFPGLVESVSADQIVHEGQLSGEMGDPEVHDILIPQFDTLGGTRALNFIQIDYLTSVIGGGQAEGSGQPVHIYVQLDANYSLADESLADTMALIDYEHPNNNNNSFTLFNNDTEQVILDDPKAMQPWTGSDSLTMNAWTQFQLAVDPPDLISFSAGGTVRYTVTYDFDLVEPTPGDVNGDGAVDVTDLLELLAAWGSCSTCDDCTADLNDDCTVDVTDLLEMLSHWTG